MNRGRIWPVAALLALSLIACGKSKGKTANPIVEATTRPGQVTLNATGASTIHFAGSASLQIIVTDQRQADPNLRFTSVSLASPVRSGGLQFQAGFNLVGTSGDGTFQIGLRPASPSPGAIPSVAYVQLLTPTRLRYDKPQSPCTVEVRNGAHSGRLECPALTDDKGKSVSLTMTWSAS